MFIEVHNARFKAKMFTDSRLVNLAPQFCLCSNCAKSDVTEGVICPIHEEFMKMTQRLNLAAPVFACKDFVELEGFPNSLDQYYDGPNLSTENSQARYYEHVAKLRKEWKAQQEKWKEEVL